MSPGLVQPQDKIVARCASTIYPYSFRHIQGLLGHASPTTTALYAQLTPTTETASREIINRLVNTLRVDLKRR